jgi:hypothetical protein
MLTLFLIPQYFDNWFHFSLQVQKRQKKDPDLVELFAHYTFQTDAPQQDPSIAPPPHNDEDCTTFQKVVRLIKNPR